MSNQQATYVTIDLTDYNQGKVVIPDTYYNPNIEPLPKRVKTWTWINFFTIWAGMVHNIPAFQLAGLLTFEFGAPLTLFIIGFAFSTLLIALYLNGHMGAKWGIPYPSSVRPMFGIKGARVPTIIRAFSALFWFAVETYVGGTIVDAVISIFYPAWQSLSSNVIGMSLHLAISVFIFWALNVMVLFRGMNEVKDFELIAGPLVLIILGGLLLYSFHLTNGIGPLFSIKGYEKATLSNVILAISAMAGFWATLVLNISDFTRFSRTQKDQLIGQTIGLPIMSMLFTFISVGITSTTIYLYHIPSSEAINYVNPVNIMYLFTDNPYLALLVGISLIIATVSVNVAANIVSPVYDLISLFPKRLDSWAKSAIVSAILSFLYVPWLWYNNAGSIENALGIIGSGLGSVAGIMIADYWILNKTEISLIDLFKPDGKYWYTNGYSVDALLAMTVGFAIPIMGFLISQLSFLYDYGWYLALFSSLTIYVLLRINRESVKYSKKQN
ncbi:cytosine permease [Sulfolobus tengchongensis]|uniref:Cytosine permease n=1 Tax=Sulfolobus tengchongensis TaxID=207809 RepID=A0AAX4L141_9CREN